MKLAVLLLLAGCASPRPAPADHPWPIPVDSDPCVTDFDDCDYGYAWEDEKRTDCEARVLVRCKDGGAK